MLFRSIEQVVAKPVPPNESKILVNLTVSNNEAGSVIVQGARLKNSIGEFEALRIQPKDVSSAKKKCLDVEIFFEVPAESNESCFDLILEIYHTQTGRDLSHGKDLLCWGRTKPRTAMIGYLNLKRTFGSHYQINTASKLDDFCAVD